ncbi:MAG: LapA family protein [Syntrophaceae bacterium]|nr:LapA family protein [Syntrophaceae bacterium]
MHLKIILMFIVICLALVFTIQNVAVVTVSIFFWEISLSLALLIFFILASGFIIGWFLHSFLAYRKDVKEVAEIQTSKNKLKK